MDKRSILLMDSDEKLLHLNKRYLEAKGYQVNLSKTYDETLRKIKESFFDLAILDWEIEGAEEGIQALKGAKKKNPEMTAIITEYKTRKSTAETLLSGIFDFMFKPYKQSELLLRVNNGLGRLELEKEVVKLSSEVKTLQEELKAKIDNEDVAVSLKVKKSIN